MMIQDVSKPLLTHLQDLTFNEEGISTFQYCNTITKIRKVRDKISGDVTYDVHTINTIDKRTILNLSGRPEEAVENILMNIQTNEDIQKIIERTVH